MPMKWTADSTLLKTLSLEGVLQNSSLEGVVQKLQGFTLNAPCLSDAETVVCITEVFKSLYKPHFTVTCNPLLYTQCDADVMLSLAQLFAQ